ncbi:MAG: branched-chain amino acid ABC transporter permease [Rhizobiales bacterium 65-9]|nr:branched-chain amino acid ABC transporter permease [Hyphomicrobiales bacterium]OJY36713.1 MAG: branched-chain amino acid ABC transporter permease [Rhizobiales bacterium 65-9]
MKFLRGRFENVDWPACAVLPVFMLAALPFMNVPTWLTLTIAGAAMGMMLFLMASGLSLIFGLMDVITFAHGAFISLGAYLAVEVARALPGLIADPSWSAALLVLAAALALAIVVTGAVGWLFEAVIIRRVYGSHLRQILITVGGLIVAQELIIVFWGANPIPLQKPAAMRGSIVIAGAAIEVYRLVAVALGLVICIALQFVLARTRLGLVVRAGVENIEMVEALGFRVRRLFVGVFVAGTALAGVGGVMWGFYQGLVTPAIGPEMMILVFIILIIGGMGSIGGSLVAAILVGLMTNYSGFLAPKLALGSNILLMVAVLLWRPRGLFPLVKS